MVLLFKNRRNNNAYSENMQLVTDNKDASRQHTTVQKMPVGNTPNPVALGNVYVLI